MATESVGTGRVGRIVRTAGWYALLLFLALIALFPVWTTILAALTPAGQLLTEKAQITFPENPEWSAFGKGYVEAEFGRRLWISVAMTAGICAAQIVTSILAAYAFVFMRFPFRRTLFLLTMATLMLPIEVTLIPNVRLIDEWGWDNSLQGLIVPSMATAFGIFLIRQGFAGVPKDLLDASKLDGYGHWSFLWRVAVPLNRPVIASFGLISFLGAWNQYLWPRAITTEGRWETIQIGLRSVSRSNIDEINVAFAAALLAALPLVILLIVFNRQIVRGLTAGAVKG
jgi:sn-glycerol 3-phosphate transport system permease protein